MINEENGVEGVFSDKLRPLKLYRPLGRPIKSINMKTVYSLLYLNHHGDSLLDQIYMPRY